jgi:thiamine transport system permease protein
MIQPFVPPMTLALPVTVLVNLCAVAALSLPHPFARGPRAAGRLRSPGRQPGADRLARLRWLVLPRLARPLGFGAGIAAALSMGDLGVIALFAGEHQATLPLVVSQLTGAYRMEAAASAALILVTLSFALFWAFDPEAAVLQLDRLT